MAMSEAKKKANKKWNDANLKDRYDRLQLVVPKGQKEIIQAAAAKCGESVNGFINRLIDAELERLAQAEGGGVVLVSDGGAGSDDSIRRSISSTAPENPEDAPKGESVFDYVQRFSAMSPEQQQEELRRTNEDGTKAAEAVKEREKWARQRRGKE